MVLFLVIFVGKSLTFMVEIPFHDFDEAHRAENAKRMKEYGSWLVPLSGSQFDRVVKFSIPVSENSDLRLYYHIERPFLVYLLMTLSTTVFGAFEWAYRLPSFILGLSTFLIYLIFSQRYAPNVNFYALFLGLLAILTSADLWLSSQYAQLDTGLSLFLFSSLLFLIFYVQRKKDLLLVCSGLTFGLSVLSKGQPAVIFVLPLVALLLMRKIGCKDLLKFLASASVLLVPWILYLGFKFGFLEVIKIFVGFGFSSTVRYIHHDAPFFWYARWWWDSLRPGWTIFLALLLWDLVHHQLSWPKKVLLSYILGGLVIFSLPHNKIWWYILPLAPALAFYIFLSAADYLKRSSNRLINLSLVVILAAMPIFMGSTNRMVMLYGIVVTTLSLIILNSKVITRLAVLLKFKGILFLTSVIFTFVVFNLNFPRIIPYYFETKEVAQYFGTISDKKCLWMLDMPAEAALFYSNAGEILPFNIVGGKLQPDLACNNYIITLLGLDDKDLIYFPDKKIIFQQGDIKLIKL